MPYCTHCGRKVGDGDPSCPDCGQSLKPRPAAGNRQMPAGVDGATLAGWVLAGIGALVMILAGMSMTSIDRYSPAVGAFANQMGIGFIGLGLFGIGIALLVFAGRAR